MDADRPRMGQEEEEGKQQFVSMLPSCLEALCSMQGAPHDDTILHHLLDVIRKLIISVDDAQRSGLFDFMDTVKEKVNDLNSAVVVLALGVAAHLISITSHSGDLCQKATLLWDVIQSSAAAENSSVGAACYNSLAKVAAYPAGLGWLESSKTHFQAALSTLETAQSVFLLNAAENFVLVSLTNTLDLCSTSPVHSPPASSMLENTMRLLSQELMEMKKNRATLLDHMIVSSHVSTFHQSLTKIVSMLSRLKAFCEWKAEDETFVTTLAHLALQHTSEKIQSSALQSIVNLVEYMRTKEKFLKKEIVSPLLKLMSEGGVERGVSIATAFVNASQDIGASDALKTMQKLVQLPHDLVFGQQTHCAELTSLLSSVSTSLCDQHRFSRLISSLMYSLKQTHNRDGLVRLVQSASITREDKDWPSLLTSWPQGMGAVIVNNRKLLNSLLDFLQREDCLDLSMEQCTHVLTSLMRIMRRPLIESRLYSPTCAAFLVVLRKHCKCLSPGETAGMQEVLCQWVEVMGYRLVAEQWEILDTTLELICNVIGIISDPWFHASLLEHHLLRQAWSCSKYGESYPRASAVSLATSLVTLPDLWQAFLQDAETTETALVDEMIEMLTSDTEAFPRRAAVLLLSTLVCNWTLKHPTTLPSDTAVQRNKICVAMTSAMNDFDWDVKLRVLDFWEKLASPLYCDGENVKTDGKANTSRSATESQTMLHRKRSAPNQQSCVTSKDCHDILETLLRDGFGEALLIGAEDYDSAVKHKALHMLVAVQEQVEKGKDSPVKTQKLDKQSDVMDASSAEMVDEEISNGESTVPTLNTKTSVVSVNQFLRDVSQLDPISQLKQQGPSADEYDQKPASLLEDVMAAVKLASAVSEVTLMSEDEFDDADDMFVDCY